MSPDHVVVGFSYVSPDPGVVWFSYVSPDPVVVGHFLMSPDPAFLHSGISFPLLWLLCQDVSLQVLC